MIIRIVCPCCNHHIAYNTAAERFWSHVDKQGPIPENKPCSGNCWIWLGHCDSKNGYGIISIDAKSFKAHRYSFLLAHGEIPADMLVRHKCDNPPCVNPDHLELGTAADNMRDRLERGKYAVGSAHVKTTLTEDQVISIREEYASGEHTYLSLAAKYHISKASVADIIKRRVWTHV